MGECFRRGRGKLPGKKVEISNLLSNLLNVWRVLPSLAVGFLFFGQKKRTSRACCKELPGHLKARNNF